MANHEMQVGVFKAPLWSWLAFGISIVSFVTHIIAFGMPEWVWYPGTYKGKAGIWLQCGGDSCTPHDTSTLEGKGRRSNRSTMKYFVFQLLVILILYCNE